MAKNILKIDTDKILEDLTAIKDDKIKIETYLKQYIDKDGHLPLQIRWLLDSI